MAKFHMAPMPSALISSGSKKKEPICACLSEAKASHSHTMFLVSDVVMAMNTNFPWLRG